MKTKGSTKTNIEMYELLKKGVPIKEIAERYKKDERTVYISLYRRAKRRDEMAIFRSLVPEKKRGRGNKMKVERNAEMLREVMAGSSLSEVSRRHDISRERVRQVIHQEAERIGIPYEKIMLILQGKVEEAKKSEQREIFDRWMAGETQFQISESIGRGQNYISEAIKEFKWIERPKQVLLPGLRVTEMQDEMVREVAKRLNARMTDVRRLAIEYLYYLVVESNDKENDDEH